MKFFTISLNLSEVAPLEGRGMKTIFRKGIKLHRFDQIILYTPFSRSGHQWMVFKTFTEQSFRILELFRIWTVVEKCTEKSTLSRIIQKRTFSRRVVERDIRRRIVIWEFKRWFLKRRTEKEYTGIAWYLHLGRKRELRTVRPKQSVCKNWFWNWSFSKIGENLTRFRKLRQT